MFVTYLISSRLKETSAKQKIPVNLYLTRRYSKRLFYVYICIQVYEICKIMITASCPLGSRVKLC